MYDEGQRQEEQSSFDFDFMELERRCLNKSVPDYVKYCEDLGYGDDDEYFKNVKPNESLLKNESCKRSCRISNDNTGESLNVELKEQQFTQRTVASKKRRKTETDTDYKFSEDIT